MEEVDLVASPKCLLKYSKVCGWTLRAEPGGCSEPDKLLPILKTSLPDNLTYKFVRVLPHHKEKFEMDVSDFCVIKW